MFIFRSETFCDRPRADDREEVQEVLDILDHYVAFCYTFNYCGTHVMHVLEV